MTYILILWISGVGFVTLEFSSQEKCSLAGSSVMHNSTHDRGYVCVKK
jgi:hypothetical protein